MRAFLFVSLSVLALAGSGFALAGNEPLRQLIEQGKAVYDYRCYYCHGYSGDADTLAAKMLSPEPRNFLATEPQELSLAQIEEVVAKGKKGTGMPAFGKTISEQEIKQVAAYIWYQFINQKQRQPGYHTKANGWPEHKQKYAAAYPFVRQQIALDTPDDQLDDEQLKGKRLFLEGCITCHDGKTDDQVLFEPFAVSFPRSHNPFKEPDFKSGASVFAKHDQPVDYETQFSEGARLYRQNCAFCHAEDRTGKNWIGRFMQPNPRDLTDPQFMRGQTLESLTQRIALGVTNSSMPRWDRVLSKQQIQQIAAFLLEQFEKEQSQSATRQNP